MTHLETAGTPVPPQGCPPGSAFQSPTGTVEQSGIFREVAGQPFARGWRTTWAPNFLRSANGKTVPRIPLPSKMSHPAKVYLWGQDRQLPRLLLTLNSP